MMEIKALGSNAPIGQRDVLYNNNKKKKHAITLSHHPVMYIYIGTITKLRYANSVN